MGLTGAVGCAKENKNGEGPEPMALSMCCSSESATDS